MMKMADDFEVDVLGDFDFKADSNMYDINELPSKSADLLPEYTNPPWMLEQDWSLDSNMDEKSKATIGKMLLEEQFYINGKSSGYVRKNNQEKKPANYQKRSVWTEEEKRLFHQGMEVYGRSWTKIANLIPTRSSIQIKNFAHQYFKKQEKVNDTSQNSNEINQEVESVKDSIDPLAETVALVTTASPTVLDASTTRGKTSQLDSSKNYNTKRCNTKTLKDIKQKSPKYKKINQNNDEITVKTQGISVENTQNFDKVKVLSTFVNDIFVSGNIDKMSLLSDSTGNSDGFCVPEDVKPECDSDIEDDEIDIENDQDDINHILQSRSTSPNSVYETLISQHAQTYSTSTILVQDKLTLQHDGTSDQPSQSSETDTSKLGISSTHLNSDNDAIPSVSENNLSDVCKEKMSHSDESSQNTGNVKTVLIDNEDGDSSTDLDQGCKESSTKQYVNAALDCEGNLIDFPIPTAEIELDVSMVTEREKKFHKDFFESRSVMKTPERYMKIRNFLIHAWKKTKPCYLRKTSVRTGLKNCGDVNCIGRVHAYLECIGAINFNCDEVSYKNPRLLFPYGYREKSKDDKSKVSIAKLEAMRPRKRKVKDEFGVWVDEKELEGQTIEHKHKVEGKEIKQQKQSRPVYDPFKLVPCLSFTDAYQPPFHVEIHSSCLCLLDIHSHICKTEVIGLLGGRFSTEHKTLSIVTAVPCNSISTGLQCEMDPVSQTQASEEIQDSGLEVVGWYHSHPTFAPNPSVRDIETQIKFQDWFSKGGSHFVGVIVSPYNPRNPELCSEVNCLTVSQEMSSIFNCNVPYKFVYTIKPSDRCELSDIIVAAQHLASKYTTDPHRIDLTTKYRVCNGVTCMDKMIQSLKAHNTAEDNSEFLDRIWEIFSFTDNT